MSQFDSNKDYYGILGANEATSRRDIERFYKRMAARHHPDRGGSEEDMKSLNEAYQVLKDEAIRRQYDAQRRRPPTLSFTPAAAPPARDIGVFGHCLSAFLCLLIGLFLLFLVRFQWIWFLWPLAILALFVILFGVMMARSAMVALIAALPATNPFRGHTLLQEAIFWTMVGGGSYGVYLLLTAVE
jgi:hypothetical protein